MTEIVSEPVGMDYLKIPVSYFVAQLVDGFRFPWEDEGSAVSLINIDEDEGFSDSIREPSHSFLYHVLQMKLFSAFLH